MTLAFQSMTQKSAVVVGAYGWYIVKHLVKWFEYLGVKVEI
jgi:hypothetical protein